MSLLMGHVQKGKNKKRRKSWHRGRVEYKKWRRAMDRWPKQLRS